MKKQYGFTLVEMAVVLVIVGLILGGMFSGLTAMRETAKFKEDHQKLQDIKASLLSFVAINNRLPCPDSDNDGQENLNADFCQQDFGTLPFADLGTHASNAYGLAFSYQVNRQADTSDANDTANSASYFGVCADGACFDKDTPPKSGTPGAGNFTVEDGSSNNLAIQIPLLVISHGQNGCPSSRSSEESNNCSNLETTTTYYQAPQNRDSFDDVLIWLSSLEIKAATPEVLSGQTTPTTPPLPDGVTQPVDFENINYDTVSTDGSDIGTIGTNENIQITGDLDSTLNFSSGSSDNNIYVEGDINQDIGGSSGNSAQGIKNLYVAGDLNADISLETNSDSYIEVGGKLNGLIELTGNADHTVIIHGEVTANGSINITRSGAHVVYLGDNINGGISVAGNNSTIYLGKTPAQVSTDELSRISSNGTVLCRETIGSTNFVSCN